MTSFENAEIDQGRSFTRPPLFHGSNFALWKKLMQIFIKDHDYEVCEIISRDDFVPTMKERDKIVLKPILAFTHEETKKMAKNCRALKILFCGFDSNKFNHVFACDIAKVVWGTLKTTYKETSQVQESKISLYVLQYELFKMLPRESIKYMYMPFI